MDTLTFTSSSRNVDVVEWSDDTLVVTFKNGRKYRYSEVPEDIFRALHDAETSGGSVGSTFNALVRNGGFDTEEITGQ